MGLRVILVSGREYPTLASIARRIRVVDAVVAENGALVDSPFVGRPKRYGRATGTRVRERFAITNLHGIEVGEVVVSVPLRSAREAGRRVAGLAVTLVRNADRVMIVPRGVDKATGVRAAMRGLRLGAASFAAIGDGDNDLPLLRAAALAGAVHNARPGVRAESDYICKASVGAGVREFVRGPLSDQIAARGRAGRSRSATQRAARTGIPHLPLDDLGRDGPTR